MVQNTRGVESRLLSNPHSNRFHVTNQSVVRIDCPRPGISVSSPPAVWDPLRASEMSQQAWDHQYSSLAGTAGVLGSPHS